MCILLYMLFGNNLKPPGIAYQRLNNELQRHSTDTARCNLQIRRKRSDAKCHSWRMEIRCNF